MARRTGASNVDRGQQRHIENYNNPHRVTAEQIGGYSQQDIDGFIQQLGNTIRSSRDDNLNSLSQIDDKLDAVGNALNEAILQALEDANFYTDQEIENLNLSVNNFIDDQISNLDFYTKSEVDARDKAVNNAINQTINNLDYYTRSEIDQINQAITDNITQAYEDYVSQADFSDINDDLNDALAGKVSLGVGYQDVEITTSNGILITGYNEDSYASRVAVGRINLRGAGQTSEGTSYAGIHIQKNTASDIVNNSPVWTSKFWADLDGNIIVKGNIQTDAGSVFVGTPSEGVVVDGTLGILINSDSNGVRTLINSTGNSADTGDVDYAGIAIQKNVAADIINDPANWETQFYADQDGNLFMTGTLQPGSILTGSPAEGVVIDSSLGVLVNSDSSFTRILLNASGTTADPGVDVDYAGITIQRDINQDNNNPDWESQFFADATGNIFLKGTLQAGTVLTGTPTEGVTINDPLGVLVQSQSNGVRVFLNAAGTAGSNGIDNSFSGIMIQKYIDTDDDQIPDTWYSNFFVDQDGDLFLEGNVQLASGSILVGSTTEGVFIDPTLGLLVQGPNARVVLNATDPGTEDVSFAGINVQKFDTDISDWVSNFYATPDGDIFVRGQIATTGGFLGGELTITGSISIGDPVTVKIGKPETSVLSFVPPINSYKSDSPANISFLASSSGNEKQIEQTAWQTTYGPKENITLVGLYDFSVSSFVIFDYILIELIGRIGTGTPKVIVSNRYTSTEGITYNDEYLVGNTFNYDEVALRITANVRTYIADSNANVNITNISLNQQSSSIGLTDDGLYQRISSNRIVPYGTGGSGGSITVDGSSVSDWTEILNKPFSTVSNQFVIASDELQLPQDIDTTANPTFNNLTLTGDLEVSGTINYVNETNLQVEDKTITLNVNGTDASSENAGFIIERVSANQSVLWDSTNGFVFSDSIKINGVIDIDDPSFTKVSMHRGTGVSSIAMTSNEDSLIMRAGSDGNTQIVLNRDNEQIVQTVAGTDVLTLSPLGADVIGNITSSFDIIASNDFQSDNFSEGTNATGWTVDGGAGFASVDNSGVYWTYTDNLTVRGTLKVYELIVKQIESIGGTEILSIANGTAESVSGSAGSEVVTIEDPEGTTATQFADGDLCVIQRFNPNSSTLVKSEYRTVSGVSGLDVTFTSTSGAPVPVDSLTAGDFIVVYGNDGTTSGRDNIIYRSVEGNPIVRLQTGINSYSDFNSPASTTQVAYGDLNGLVSGFSSPEFGIAIGDMTLNNNHIVLTPSTTSFQLDTFKLNTPGLDIDSTVPSIVIGTGGKLEGSNWLIDEQEWRHPSIVNTIYARTEIAGFAADDEADSLLNQTWVADLPYSTSSQSDIETKIRTRYYHRQSFTTLNLSGYIGTSNSGDGDTLHNVIITIKNSAGSTIDTQTFPVTGTAASRRLEVDITGLSFEAYYIIEVALEAATSASSSGLGTAETTMREDVLIFATIEDQA